MNDSSIFCLCCLIWEMELCIHFFMFMFRMNKKLVNIINFPQQQHRKKKKKTQINEKKNGKYKNIKHWRETDLLLFVFIES